MELLQVKNAHETFFGEYQLQVLYKINAQMESHNNNQNVIEQFDNWIIVNTVRLHIALEITNFTLVEN